MQATLFSLKINNKPYGFLNTLTIFQACFEKKIYVPRFCYHVALKIAGNCRMCLIEEKSSIKPVASCAVTIVDGMSVFTQTELVKKAREGVIEYLLINHPLDCPICDQGGECDLQDQTMVFGADRGRFYEEKRSTPNKNLGFLIKTFLNRCIHCARCTRFLHDVAFTEDISLLGRGLKTEISNYVHNFLKSEISGNIIDLCPVGALTSKPYAYKARPWELVSVYTYDIFEPMGANIEINYRGLELMRILPRINYDINEEWISDKTRFIYDAFNIQRLTASYKIILGNYLVSSWLTTFRLWKNIHFNLLQLLLWNNMRFSDNNSFSSSEYSDLEIFATINRAGHTFSLPLSLSFLPDFRENFFSTKESVRLLYASDAERPKSVVIIGVNPRLESPVLNIKIRRFVEEHNASAFLFGFASNLNFKFKHGGLFFNRRNYAVVDSLLSEALVFTSERYTVPSTSRQIYRIAEHISVLNKHEVGSQTHNARFQSGMNFFLGQPFEKILKNFKRDFIVAMLHHVEDIFWANFQRWNGIKFPAKFYMEKVGSYFSENGYFFSTLTNIHGYSIRGTKEEWKIFSGLMEFGGLRQILASTEDFKTFKFGRFLHILAIYFPRQRVEFFNKIFASRILNYYSNTLLSRISPVLSLCAKVYVTAEDYKFCLKL